MSSCAKVSLQPFVDWMTAPQQGLFVHAVTAHVLETPQGQSLTEQYVGSLLYVPVRIIGHPPEPGKPGLRFSNFFQGNLVTAAHTGGVRHMLIELFDPVEIILETLSGHNVTNTVTLTNISCSPSGTTGLTLVSPGTDGAVYEVVLNRTSFFHTPQVIGFGHAANVGVAGGAKA